MRVLCTRPNASEEISGVKFTAMDGGMLSDELDEAAGAAFLEIDGYLPADTEGAVIAPLKRGRPKKATDPDSNPDGQPSGQE